MTVGFEKQRRPLGKEPLVRGDASLGVKGSRGNRMLERASSGKSTCRGGGTRGDGIVEVQKEDYV